MKAFIPILLAVICGFAATVESTPHWGHHWGGGDEGWGWGKGWGWDKTSSAAPSTTAAPTTTAAAAPPKADPIAARKNLDTLYAQCKAEGNRVIIYAGGDTPDQQDYTKAEFIKAFPGVKTDMIVDYSKFHDARIDIQLAEKKLVPDVVQLQTVQDFPRWRDQGVLLPYKPPGFEQIYDGAKDRNGYYVGIAFYFFTNLVSTKLIPDPANWPREALDYLKPELKNHLVWTYPNDDDAILFWLKKVTEKYGLDYIKKLKDQNVRWVRGTQEPSDDVYGGQKSWATPATSGDMSNPPNSSAVLLLPRKDPFMSWPQLAAIFKDSKRPSCAKLYISWAIDKATQENNGVWSTRRDVAPPKNYKSIFDYWGQTDPFEFLDFMSDRAAVERFKTKVSLLIGEVKGDPSPGYLDLYVEHASNDKNP